jgi:hypothetical protein
MKRIFWGFIILLCAYGVLSYALDNPNGAKMLRQDIDAAVDEGIETAKETAKKAEKYVDNLSDEE